MTMIPLCFTGGKMAKKKKAAAKREGRRVKNLGLDPLVAEIRKVRMKSGYCYKEYDEQGEFVRSMSSYPEQPYEQLKKEQMQRDTRRPDIADMKLANLSDVLDQSKVEKGLRSDVCLCGCEEKARRMFQPGHDAKLKSLGMRVNAGELPESEIPGEQAKQYLISRGILTQHELPLKTGPCDDPYYTVDGEDYVCGCIDGLPCDRMDEEECYHCGGNGASSPGVVLEKGACSVCGKK